MEPRHERAPVEGQGVLVSLLLKSLFEGPDIAGEKILVQPHLVLAAGLDHPIPQLGPEDVQGLIQSVPGVGEIRLGPESGHEEVPAEKSSLPLEGQEGQDGNTLRLRKERGDLPSSGVSQIDPAQ